ncbi:winged helix-turn-helix transcriptional regulator [Arenibacter sp. 6A1]|uniref:MarR family winged helix-turn-helix transcriptional regulator n=1 Tax=Arenibacter sp. 6A1 TaxID=2720391 RepID=UPI0014457347|nr:MarR family winged helix-turn-helix transcriptional regulator [Arenibacter sp. 6A1]NKI25854.1 winged helix-turn-helix transcriptional regulator [Arenibacter sp. 6A1]
MPQSIYDTDFQQKDLGSKIVIALDRLSEVFRALLRDYAKTSGISPIQIQILIFIAYHKQSYCTVSHLAKEFNLSKPTISDAIKILHQKDLIVKETSTLDTRSYTLSLSESGKQIVSETEGFANPIRNALQLNTEEELYTLYDSLSTLIYRLNQTGALQVQRICYACKFYENNNGTHHCNLLQKNLHIKEIRVDCPEFDKKQG